MAAQCRDTAKSHVFLEEPRVSVVLSCSVNALWLCRCQFETGEAPEFNLVEMGPGMFGRSRRLIFRASTVEECCEWAIGLREAIRGD